MREDLDDYARRTLSAYRRHADVAIKNWRRYCAASTFLRRFVRGLAPGALVLDYGCGIGTDLAWLRRRGFRVEGVDGTPEFVEQARRRCPGSPIMCRPFEATRLPARRFDAIWCRAALIHVPPDAVRHELRKLRRALVPGGRLGLTLAWGWAEGYTQRDWIPDRFVVGYRKAQAQALLAEWSIQEVRVMSGDGRQGRWIYLSATSG